MVSFGAKLVPAATILWLASTLEPTSSELKLTVPAVSPPVMPVMPVLAAGGGNAGGASGGAAAVPLGGGLEGTGDADSLPLPHAESANAAASETASIKGGRVFFMEAPLFHRDEPGDARNRPLRVGVRRHLRRT